MDLEGAFTNIFRLLPETSEVVVIVGRTPLEQFWSAELLREFQPFAGRARLTFWDDLPYSEILQRSAALPERTAILYTFFVGDAGGLSHLEDSALDALHSAASAPIFGLFDSQLGRGIVGGPLIPFGDLAREAADAANRLLAGEPPSRVRRPPDRPGRPDLRRAGNRSLEDRRRSPAAGERAPLPGADALAGPQGRSSGSPRSSVWRRH